MYQYIYGGHLVSSDVAIPQLGQALHDSTPTIDILTHNVSFDTDLLIGRWQHHWHDPADQAKIVLSIAKIPEAVVLHVPQHVYFMISRCGKEIRVAGPPRVDEETMRHLLLDQVLPRVLAQNGHLVLHGGTTNIEGSAVAFLGQAGQGKSTLAASFDSAGCPIIGDDSFVLTSNSFGIFVRPTYRSLRLLPSSIAGLYVESPILSEFASYFSKKRLQLDDEYPATGMIPLAACFMLAPEAKADSSRIIVRRLSPREACIGMMANSFQLDVTNAQHVGGLLTQASKIANRVPVYEIGYPRDFSRLPDVRAAILSQQQEWYPSCQDGIELPVAT